MLDTSRQGTSLEKGEFLETSPREVEHCLSERGKRGKGAFLEKFLDVARVEKRREEKRREDKGREGNGRKRNGRKATRREEKQIEEQSREEMEREEEGRGGG